jgi:hypothetical protein
MDKLGTMIEVVIDDVGDPDTDKVGLKLDVGVGRLVWLLEALKEMVAEGDGVAVMDMVYDEDGVRVDDLEALLEEEGLRLEVREDEGDLVRVIVFEADLEEVLEKEGVTEDVTENEEDFVAVDVHEEVIEGEVEVVGDEDAV